jgi:hypothetical protein
MTQDSLRERHLSGRLVEFTFDSLPEQASVPESIEAPVAKKRAKRTPGGLSAATQKKNQRARSSRRQEVWALTADQELVASVVDRASYIRALQAVKQREERRANDEVSYNIRLSSGWQSLGPSGPRAIVECLRQDNARGLGARKKTRLPARLQEGFHEEIIRIIDDETSSMFSRILAQDLHGCPVGDSLTGDNAKSMTVT